MSGGESGSTVTVHDGPAATKSDDDNWKQRVLEEVACIRSLCASGYASRPMLSHQLRMV